VPQGSNSFVVVDKRVKVVDVVIGRVEVTAGKVAIDVVGAWVVNSFDKLQKRLFAPVKFKRYLNDLIIENLSRSNH
jgi:hypothetical protein